MLGGGDDNLEVNIAGYADVSSVIDAGGGRDGVKYKMLFAPLILDSDRARLNFFASLGDGDDSLDIDAAGYPVVDTFIDAGAGNDSIWIDLSAPVRRAADGRSQLTVSVLLGARSDILVMNSFGFHEIKFHVNTGPANDGGDYGYWRSRFGNSHGRITEINEALDDGLDDWSLRSEGYEVFLLPSTSDDRDLNINSSYVGPTR